MKKLPIYLKKVPLQVQLEPHHRAEFVAICEKSNVSASEVLRKFVLKTIKKADKDARK